MKLFVYGTLKKGFYNHRRFGMDKLEFIGNNELLGYSLVKPNHLPYPFLVRNGGGAVIGEVYNVDHNTLEVLDKVESGAGYKRIEVTLLSGMKAFVYVDASNNSYEGLERLTEFKG